MCGDASAAEKIPTELQAVVATVIVAGQIYGSRSAGRSAALPTLDIGQSMSMLISPYINNARLFYKFKNILFSRFVRRDRVDTGMDGAIGSLTCLNILYRLWSFWTNCILVFAVRRKLFIESCFRYIMKQLARH